MTLDETMNIVLIGALMICTLLIGFTLGLVCAQTKKNERPS
jgi:hypothetical protein